MVQRWSSSSEYFFLDFISTTAGYKGREEDKQCGLNNLSSSCILFWLFFSFLSLVSPFLYLDLFIFFHPFFSSWSTVLSFSRLLTPSGGIVACQSMSEASHIRCSTKSRVEVCPSIQKRCSAPGLHCTVSTEN